MYVPYNPSNGLSASDFGDFKPYSSTDNSRQHLHIFQTPSEERTPVFLYAHAEGVDAAQMPDPAPIAAAGFSIISWETVSDGSDIPTCQADGNLVYNWLEANADAYNLDLSFIVVAGSSAGAACTWDMAHSGKPGIQALYMVDPIPDKYWESGNADTFTSVITANSPPMNMVYSSDCTGDITQCDPDPNTGHNPAYGQYIVKAYAEVGMGSFVKIMTGLTNNGVGTWAYFPRFAAALFGHQEELAQLKLKASGQAPEGGNE